MSTREEKLRAVASAYKEWKPTGVFRDEYLASEEDEDAFVALLAKKDKSLDYTAVDKTEQ